VEWPQSGSEGVLTLISIAQLACDPAKCADASGAETGFIDDEEWLATSDRVNWLEAGYSTFTSGGSTKTDYFWAQQDNGQYGESDLAFETAGDAGMWGLFDIHATDTGIYAVSIVTPSYAFATFPTASAPLSFNMIGQELYGAGGADAGYATFAFNQFYDASSGLPVHQTTDGVPDSYSPPFGVWTIPPSKDQLHTGGSFVTWCCQF
jgi:hypothetical protein